MLCSKLQCRPFIAAVVVLQFYFLFQVHFYHTHIDYLIRSDEINEQHRHQIKFSSTSSTSSTSNNNNNNNNNNNKKHKEIFSKNYDVCVVGSGLSGSVIAEQYANILHKKVLIIEKRNHIGGNCYDYIDEDTNIRVSKYGAHLFHTNSERVWEYIHQYSQWTPYEHRVLGLVKGKHVPIPVNIDTVNQLFDLNITSSTEMEEWLDQERIHYNHEPSDSQEMALSRVGPRLYDLIFKPYTFKQWAKYPNELGPEVTARIPVRNDHDDRYFPNDKYQVLPTHGYTKFFENMILNNPFIEVVTDVDYFEVRDQIHCDKL